MIKSIKAVLRASDESISSFLLKVLIASLVAYIVLIVTIGLLELIRLHSIT